MTVEMGSPDEWLSSWYPETHMSQKMVIEAKRKEVERFTQDEGVSCCHKGIHGEGRRGEDDQHQVGHHKQMYRRTPSCQSTSCGTPSSTLETNVVSCLQEHPGLMAMRTMISRAMTRCENGDDKDQSCCLMSRQPLHVRRRQEVPVRPEWPPEDTLAASGRYVGKLEPAMYGTRDTPMIWQDHLRKTLLEMTFKESVTHPVVFQHETRDIFLCVHVDGLLCTGLREDLMWLRETIAEGV